MDSEFSDQSQLKQVLKLFIELEKKFVAESDLIAFVTYAHQLLKQVISCENFYLARYYPEQQTLMFPYFVDQKEPTISPERSFNLPATDESPTAWIIQHKKRLYFVREHEQFALTHNNNWRQGSLASCWLGFPLIAPSGECIGAVVIQSYEENSHYNELEQYIFGLFAGIIASAVIKHDINQNASFIVSTQLQALEHKLASYEKDRKLQNALYQIAQLSNESIELYEFYQKIHQIIDAILYAKNFYIALYDESQHCIQLPYFVDINDGRKFEGKTLPVGNGLTSYVLRTQQAVRLNKHEVEQLLTQGKIKDVLGDTSFSMWMAAPLIQLDKILGVIVVQSYHDNVIFTEQDLSLLKFVANHIASALAITQQKLIDEQNKQQLAQQQQLLKSQNEQLYNAFKRLKSTQQELLQQEKMASLGELVAGVAHEINTPLGVCVTAISHLDEIYQDFYLAYKAGRVSKKLMENFLLTLRDSLSILASNSERAADLVQSFKQVAVDQTTDDIRTINLSFYLHEIVLSLQPKFKDTQHKILIQCDENIELNTRAGAIAQLLTNLMMNSLIHGFENIKQGEITITVIDKITQVKLIYADNGQGVTDEQLRKIFNPFFTTKRGTGGSGLGTHIVYNIVTSALKGKIVANHHKPHGLSFTIIFPKIL